MIPMLQTQLKNDMKEAMIAKDTTKRDILRFVISQVKNKEIDTQKELTDDEIIKIIQKEIKQINETRAWFETSWDSDAVLEEDKKIATLSVYLPEMLDEDTLREIVQKKVWELNIDDPKQNRGQLIGAIMGEYGARVDGKLLNEIITTL